MNHLVSAAAGCLLLFGLGACAKKEAKPLRTEPWLAHPVASTPRSSDAAVPLIRYAITEQSLIRFELPSKGGPVRGTLTHVSGEFGLDLGDLTRSRAQVQASLDSLTVLDTGDRSAATLLARARNALDLTDAGAPAAFTSFELTALEDLSPAQLEPAPGSDAGAPFTRRARATAVGNLLLHGFRVLRRLPLEAEFGFAGDRQVPSTLVIRSRAPFVLSLETHDIHPAPEANPGKASAAPLSRAHEVRVSIELYGRKID